MNTPHVRIGDLAEQIRGVTYNKVEASRNPQAGYLPVLRAGNITDSGLTFDDLVYVPACRISVKQKIRRHDVVIAASSGSLDVVGKAASAADDFDGSFGAFCKVLRPDPLVNASYFSQFFKTPVYRNRISTLAAGANINNLRNEHLEEMRIPLPPMKDQRRIAEVLDRTDAVRAKRREALARLDELTQSLFLDIFGDPVANPKGWHTSSIGALSEVGTGSTPSRTVEGYFGGKPPWVKTTEVDWNVIDDTDEKLTSEGLKASRCKVHPAGSIVMALYGQGKTRGKVAVLGMDAATNQACAVIQPNESYSTPFLFTLLRLSYNALRGRSRGGNQENLNLRIVSEFEVICPALEFQQEFARRVEGIERIKVSQRGHLAGLDALFSSLQDRAFGGRL